MTTSAISLHGLTKRFGDRVAVDNLTVEVPRGVVAGFIGPNGAGKTTTMAMLLGLVTPTAGTGTVLGHPLQDPRSYLRRVGALVEGPALWPALTGAENLGVLAELGGHDIAQIPSVLDTVGLRARAGDRFGSYSFGMKQRLGIAAALLGEPDLLILDEPTNGLDPAGIAEMRALIATLGSGDRTVLVSSHILGELELVCDWLIVIDNGAPVYAGPAEAFLATATPVVAVAPEHHADLPRLADIVVAEGLDIEPSDGSLLVDADGRDPRALAVALNRAAGSEGIVLAELHVRRPDLESHYLSLLEGASR